MRVGYAKHWGSWNRSIADFQETHFADGRYGELPRTIMGMVEGYDAADPRRASGHRPGISRATASRHSRL